MIGILYCSKSAFPYKEIELFLAAKHIDATCIALEAATPESLQQCSLLLNVMGDFFVEEKIGLLTDFFSSGKSIINLQPAPFTRNAEDGKCYNRILRSFEIIDDFRPLSETCTHVMTKDDQRHEVCLDHLYSAVYHLCQRDQHGTTAPCAYLESILEAYNEQDQLVAAPITRIVTHKKGSMTFFHFDFTPAMLKEPFWQQQLLTLIQRELTGNVLLSADCSYARYYPEEKKFLTIALHNISLQTSSDLTLQVSIQDQNAMPVFTYAEQLNSDLSLPFQKTLELPLTNSSLYKVTISVKTEDLLIAEKTTGFLVISDEEICQELSLFHPMYIDEQISSDYCLVDGKPTAILGTTYFVTDVYRSCFYDMNAWLCSQEMAQLHQDGFNVFRTGNWVYKPELYEADGSIAVRGLRALQTYFLLAARNGFTVQFVLGNVLLNQWDKSRSPIHDAGMRQKCMQMVSCFAENFKDYPNVVFDIVNEPSYSIKGAWTPGRPSGEEGELIRYRQWLSDKYKGNISALRKAWGESAAAISDFSDITMPPSYLFGRGLARTEERRNFTVLADFFAFAREEFSDWTGEIRRRVREIAPNMMVIMGRDETLRIPTQQDEVLAGNIDMVCWHQWNYNTSVIGEYLINRVRGKVCVAQELGMYKYDDICCGKRHSDEEMAPRITKKLLCAFGNFVQWQSHDDPFLYELSENSLGLYRADMAPTPSLTAVKKLIAAERNMQSRMLGKEDDKVKIVTLYNTSYHFSVDHPFTLNGIRTHIDVLHYHLKEQSNFMLEHLFKKEHAGAIGNPKLIILPGMQTLQQGTWKELLSYVKDGVTLLVCGCIDRNEFFAEDAKIGTLDPEYTTRKLNSFEKLSIQGKEYTLDFRQMVGYVDVSNVFNCGHTSAGNEIAEYALGKGRILYCPYPIEFSSNTEAICACYQYAIERARAQNDIYKVMENKPNLLLTAASYESCTVYTLINDGFEDSLTFEDLRSGKKFTVTVKENCGCKLWIDTFGKIIQVFGECD